jgi:anti-sigma factor RsiW
MITCRAASQLASRSIEQELSPAERSALAEHARACPQCACTHALFEAIHHACQELAAEVLQAGGQLRLPDECRMRLRARLQAEGRP